MPGLVVRSTSCDPSAIGPLGLAALGKRTISTEVQYGDCNTYQLPAGLSGAFEPKGIVPRAPTLTPPVKMA